MDLRIGAIVVVVDVMRKEKQYLFFNIVDLILDFKGEIAKRRRLKTGEKN